jgi:putative hydrolase of the HAD superfamily
MKVVAFDLGDTLVEYEGLPLSWEAHYPEALANLASFLGITAGARHIEDACAVLRRHNTRLYPREEEVSFAAILDQLLRALECDAPAGELPCATAFFRTFRKKLRCFPDTAAALAALRERQLKIGVFTDVPYGMPRELVIEDVNAAAVVGFFDALITSRDVGFRKPSRATLRSLAERLSCEVHEMIYVGNERKDIEVARACGCFSVLIDRTKHGCDWGQDRTIGSLSEL